MFRIGRTIFEKAAMLDTGPLVSLYDSKDKRGSIIDGILKAIQKNNYPIYVSIVTIAETHKRILYDVGYVRASEFLTTITSGEVNIIEIYEADINDAASIIKRYNDQDIPFADAITMAIMKRVGIRKVLSYDRHFWLLNFKMLP